MQIKKLFTMTCYFCEVSETIDMPSQRRAVVKFFDDGWRVRADEDVCPKCTSMLPLKVSRRELLETKERLLTKRAADECPTCAGLGFVNDKRGRRGVDCSDCNGSGIRR